MLTVCNILKNYQVINYSVNCFKIHENLKKLFLFTLISEPLLNDLILHCETIFFFIKKQN